MNKAEIISMIKTDPETIAFLIADERKYPCTSMEAAQKMQQKYGGEIITAEEQNQKAENKFTGVMKTTQRIAKKVIPGL